MKPSSTLLLPLLIFLLTTTNIKHANSDEMKCLCNSPCGDPCTPPVSPPPPPPSPPPPSPPQPPACPPPPSGGDWSPPPPGGDWPPQTPPVTPSAPYSPYIPYVTPGVLYPVDPAYRPSLAGRNLVHSWVVLFLVLGLFFMN